MSQWLHRRMRSAATPRGGSGGPGHRRCAVQGADTLRALLVCTMCTRRGEPMGGVGSVPACSYTLFANKRRQKSWFADKGANKAGAFLPIKGANKAGAFLPNKAGARARAGGDRASRAIFIRQKGPGSIFCSVFPDGGGEGGGGRASSEKGKMSSEKRRVTWLVRPHHASVSRPEERLQGNWWVLRGARRGPGRP